MNLLHKHQWLERTYTNRGGIGAVRKCEDCPQYQTFMFDHSTGRYRWVDGQFVPFEEHYLIFTDSQRKYQDKKLEIAREISPFDAKYTWVQYPTTFEYIRQLRNPKIVLCDGWQEMEIIYDYRFRILVETGHVVG